jgi:TonB-dependent starch-binding outer membrane protein SusC
MKKLLLLSYAVLFSVFTFAQATQVTGKVTDDNNNPLSGVSISIKSKGASAKTGNDGTFTFSTNEKGSLTLTATSVGYASKSFVWAGKEVNVKLDKTNKVEDEVVVVGYSTVKRKDLLASVSSVGAKDLKDIPINSAAEALNGRLAGVTATTAEGSPDANITIRVRGGMSITGDNNPLYVIDGVIVENALSTISPQDIQTIDVLKDAAGTAIYGARGGNGVIVITTKAGKVGKLRLSYNGFVGVKYLAKKLDVLSPLDFVKYQSERSRGNATDSVSFLKNFGTTWDTLANYANVTPVDWQDEVLGQTGINTTHNLTATGGTKIATYNFGYSYSSDKAVLRNSNFVRHQINGKTDIKLSKKLKLGLGVRLTDQNVLGAGVSDERGSSYSRLKHIVKYRPFLSANQDIDDTDPLADQGVSNGLNLYNPVALTDAEYRKKSTQGYTFTTTLGYNFNKHFSFKSTFGFDINNVIDRQFNDSITPFAKLNGNLPSATLDTTKRQTMSNSNVLTYSLKGYKKKHDLELLIGQETTDIKTQLYNQAVFKYALFTSQKDAFNRPELGTKQPGFPKVFKGRATTASFFNSVKYSFKEKYFMTFNVRADGSSKFIPGKQWGYFPAGSLAWRVSNEKFMKNINFINSLKVRAGYGLVGNNRIGDYLFLTTFNNNGQFFYGINNQQINGLVSNSLVNEDLKWESTENKNLGIDLSILKSRIDLSVDFYQNDSRDLLLNVNIPQTYGYTTQTQNVGQTRNKGYEIQLNTTILRKPNGLNWSANLNLSHNVNKIVKLGPNQTQAGFFSNWGISGQAFDYLAKIGEPVGSMFGFVTDGFYQVDDFDYNTTTGAYTLKAGVANCTPALGTLQPGLIKFKDLNGDGLVDINNDRQIIGNPTPKFTGGLNQNFGYKQWDLSVFMNFSYGNDIFNANKIENTNGYSINSNMLNIMANRFKTVTENGQTAIWTTTVGTTTTVYGIPPAQLKALNANADIWTPLKATNSAYYTHSWAIEDGSFIRLNNITLGYTLPVKSLVKMKMSKLRFYATANNLAVITNYTGYDPEVSVRKSPLTPGVDYSAYPKSRSFIFGVNATF